MPTLMQLLPCPGASLMDNEIFGHAVTQTAMFLGLITLIVATAAWLLGRMIAASTVRRLVWQVALLCVGTLSLLELTGMSGAISAWLQTPIALSMKPAATTQQENIAQDAVTSREDNSASTEFVPGSEISPAQLTALAPEAPQPARPAFVGPLPLELTGARSDSGLYRADDLLADSWLSEPGADHGDVADFGMTESLTNSGAIDAEEAEQVAIFTSPGNAPESSGGLATAFGLLWIIGAIVLFSRALLGRALLYRFAAKLDDIENINIKHAAREVAANLDCRRAPRLKFAGSLAGPLAFGIFRSTLVLPRNFSRQFTPEGQQAVLVHEIAHLRQADPLWLLTADLICALSWWNPAVWMMRSRFRLESELAADEATTCLDDGPAHLASSLLRLGTRLARPRAVGFVSADGLGLRSHLARRIERLVNLDENTCRPRRTRPFLRTLAAVCIIAGCLIGTAWARPRLPSGGDSNVSSINKSWRTSFAGAALAALLVGSPAADAQETGPPKPDEGDIAALASLEAEIVDLINANQAFSNQLAQENANAEQAFAENLASMETTIASLEETIAATEIRFDQLRARGEQAAADEAGAHLDELRAELSQRRGQIIEVQADFRNRMQNRIAQNGRQLREQMNMLEQRLDVARQQGNAPEDLQRLEDRLALLRRDLNQGAARRRTDTPPENQDARRRAPEARPRVRDRRGDDPSREDKIRLILEAANNLEAAGMKEQADELRKAARERMGGPGAGPADSTPPRSRSRDAEPRERDPRRPDQAPPGVRRAPPGADAPPAEPGPARRRATPPGAGSPPEASDAPQARRRVPGPNPPGDAPQARRRVGGPNPPGDAPQARRGGAGGPNPPSADRELLMLIRALQAEVNSLRSEVQELRQDMNRDDAPRRRVPANRGRRGTEDPTDPRRDSDNRRRDPAQLFAADNTADDPGITDQTDVAEDPGKASTGPDVADQADTTKDSGDASTGPDVADQGKSDAADPVKDTGDSPPNPGTADRGRQ